jgi:hypothetical protein
MRLFLLSSFLLLACSSSDFTTGADGRAVFVLVSDSCVEDCQTTHPLMQGTTETIAVNAANAPCTGGTCGAAIPALTITSSAPNVVAIVSATRQCCALTANSQTCDAPTDVSASCPDGDIASISVRVSALGVGSATITLARSDASIYDAVDVSVAAPATLTLDCDPLDVDAHGDQSILESERGPLPSTLTNGSKCALGWKAQDANGTTLIASTGVTIASSDPTVIGFQSMSDLDQTTTGQAQADQSNRGNTMVAALASGTSTLTAQAGGTTAVQSIRVP